MYALLADAVLVLHLAVVVFVVGGLLLVVAGNRAGWRWVNDPVFRVLHLVAIAVVVAESWLGWVCPLTTLENALRARAGVETIGPGFIEYWFRKILFHDVPAWVFILGYTLFGAAVVGAWVKYPPGRQ